MRIDYISDLHCEHWIGRTENQQKWEEKTRLFAKRVFEKSTNEVLVLAGDISEWIEQIEWVLEEATQKYERVFYTYGNHELYLSSGSQLKKYGDSIGKLEEIMKRIGKIQNVSALNKTVVEYKGKKIAGDALWYMPKGDKDKTFYRNVMSDAGNVLINGYTIDEVPMVLWKQSMDWYDTLDGQNIDLLITHTPPVHAPFSIYPPNSCFETNVAYMAASHWICGHVHLKGEFERADTNFYLNCIGYKSEYPGVKKGEIPTKEWDFDVRTFEI